MTPQTPTTGWAGAPQRTLAAALALGACAAPLRAQQAPVPAADAPPVVIAAALPPVEVIGNYDNAVGTSDAASQGTVTSKLIAARPALRPGELLEFVPGVIVTQHSGDGKANQYFLRGFNLDHGTDFATWVDGMPVNMPTHAHGQGYSDLNWLIPELVDRIAYRKGPYFADEGDFSSAGAAHIRLFDVLPKGVASVTLGENRYARGLVADSMPFLDGHLLYALELAHNDGPWDHPEKFHRLNGLLRYSAGDATTHQTLTLMGYDASWNSTDQVPLSAVDSGLIGRYGAIDPTDGGRTWRGSLSWSLQHDAGNGVFKANAYAIASHLDLYSDFTYYLEHPIDLEPTGIDGDQFEQAEQRRVYGGALSRSWNLPPGGLDTVVTLGAQARQDRLDPVGLYASVARERVGVTQESRVRQTSVGVYGEAGTQWTPWLRSVVGLRSDHDDFDVHSSIAANSGGRSATITSPKASLILGPWNKTEFFLNAGYGFHSNDARGVTETVTPKEGLPADPVTPLVRSKGAELGARTEIIPGLQSSIALWQLRLGSELVFSGDAGDTEASGASKRYGIELNNHYIAAPWLLFDLDIAASRARFDQDQGEAPHIGRAVPGSIDKVASFGATLSDLGPWFGQFQLRYFGPRPLIEDGSQRSSSTTLAYARIGYKIRPDLRVALDVFNLFDRESSDIDYDYASRLKGQPAEGVNGIHFHPVEPRTLRVTLTANF